MRPSDLFTKNEKEQIIKAVSDAELKTSGEIRVHIEQNCKEDVLDRAAYVFERLKMHKTAQRNGVLFYLAMADHRFAILGDAGINKVTPDDFWDKIKEKMQDLFKEDNFTGGLIQGIRMAGDALKKHFPYQEDDVNELSNDISFGDK